jgi:type VI secretion system protein ImpB
MSGSIHDKLQRVRKPRVHITYQVETEGAEVLRELPFVNKLAHDGGQMSVALKFDALEDFEPARVAEQVPALKALLDTRNKLRDLLSKVDRSDVLENLLEQILKNESELKTLSGELGLSKPES